jgi:hypothetical protein
MGLANGIRLFSPKIKTAPVAEAVFQFNMG